MELSATFVADYLDFCRNPLRGSEGIKAELQQLVDLPFVQYVAMKSQTELMVGLSNVVMFDEYDIGHDMGEFIVYIERYRIGRSWSVGFSFQNTSWVQYTEHTCSISVRLHPHISLGQIGDYAGEFWDLRGALCISKGQHELYEWLRRGEVHLFVARIYELLGIYGTGQPYCNLDVWQTKVPIEEFVEIFNDRRNWTHPNL